MHSLAVQSVSDALAQSLRDRILREDIPSGLSVTEAQLTSDYRVARPTAKAAIERLVSEGLLERDAHKSARVPVVTIARARDIYFTRNIIETQAYRLLAERRFVPATAREANTEIAAAASSDSLEEIVASDVRFHRALVDALESERTSIAHGNLGNEMRLCMVQVQAHHLLDPLQIVTEHTQILDAIAKGEPERAAQAGLHHLRHAEERLTSKLAP